ncbi:MAG: WD40 repeat domain-containing protein, partial [Chloroflexota bacterium]
MREDRLEAELRAALHREMAMARLGVTAPQIRTGIAARERSRRWTRAAAGIAAAFAVVLLGAPVLAPLVERALAPDQPTETAVTVRLEATGDLVVEKTPFAGSAVEMARLPRAADWLRPTVDPARLQPGTTGTVVAFHPDGYLAVAVSAADGARRPVAILAWDLARPADDPTRIDATTDLWGTPLIGWTPDGRLVVATDREASAFDVLDARTRRVVRVTLPGGGAALVRWTDNFVAGGSITSTPDSRVVVFGIDDRGTLRYTMATVELPRDGGVATLTDGLPRAVWSVTGLERLWGVNAGGVVALTGSSWRPLNHTAKGHWLPMAGVKVIRRDLNPDLRDAQTWAILGPGEQLVGVPAWDASGAGVWLLQGTGRRLDLVHLDGPGLASVGATLPWDGTTGSDRNAIAGVASDGRGLIVYRATGDLFVDGVSGRWAELPAGARFVGWAR